MEDYEGLSFERKQNVLTKKRSQISRRPRTASLQVSRVICPNFWERSFSIHYVVSSDDYTVAHSNPRTKQFNLSQRTLFSSQDTSISHSKIIGYGAGDQSKIKKVKLKVGSVTRTIETKDSSLGVLGGNLSQKRSRNVYPSQLGPKLNLQSSCGNRDSSRGKMPDNNALGHQGDNLVSVCKSKRLRKKHVLDGEFDEADEDDEIRYLKRLKTSKNAKPDDSSDDLVSSRSSKGNERSRSERGSEGTDCEEDSPFESKQQELGLTTRQRALLSGKGGYSLLGASEIEFPNGLPPAPPKTILQSKRRNFRIQNSNRKKLRLLKGVEMRKLLGSLR